MVWLCGVEGGEGNVSREEGDRRRAALEVRSWAGEVRSV